MLGVAAALSKVTLNFHPVCRLEAAVLDDELQSEALVVPWSYTHAWAKVVAGRLLR
jgi:hypothetical protein